MDDATFLSYPPYYTRQTREDTWRKQCDLWCRALLTCVSIAIAQRGDAR